VVCGLIGAQNGPPFPACGRQKANPKGWGTLVVLRCGNIGNACPFIVPKAKRRKIQWPTRQVFSDSLSIMQGMGEMEG
jgi:hypothetical protein